MGKNNNNAKATRGRSRVAPVGNKSKANIAEKNKATNTPFKILNNLFKKK